MIGEFRGDHFYLSNMYRLRSPIETSGGFEVWSAEHAWQAGKFEDPAIHQEIAEAQASFDQPSWKGGVIAKNKAHAYEAAGAPLAEGYRDPEQRIVIMGGIVHLKFLANPELANLLLNTRDEELVEGNDWGDREWGVSPIGSGDGDNLLGKILMAEREKIRNGS